ncbi:MAG: alpha/beta hydrolase, partial [Candidatus Limnocylindrales bacterium]
TPDLPGHGSRAATAFSLDASIDTIRGVIRESFGDRPCLLVGLSLGGYVTIAFTERYPALVAGLVISGTSVEPRSVAPAFIATELVLRLVPLAVLGMVSGIAVRIVYPRVADALLRPGIAFRAAADGLAAVRHVAFCPLVATFQCPVLLLNGRFDLLFRLGERRFLAATQSGRLSIIGRAGHGAPFDQPLAFAAAVRRFHASLGGP